MDCWFGVFALRLLGGLVAACVVRGLGFGLGRGALQVVGQLTARRVDVGAEAVHAEAGHVWRRCQHAAPHLHVRSACSMLFIIYLLFFIVH
jgi:hypothetical protein